MNQNVFLLTRITMCIYCWIIIKHFTIPPTLAEGGNVEEEKVQRKREEEDVQRKNAKKIINS
jgi:hypothetical protein